MNMEISIMAIAWTLSVPMTIVLLGYEHIAAVAWMW